MKDKISWTTCIKQFLRYASPYGYKLILAILALIFSNGIYAMNPSIEGSITTQLMKDVEEISKGVEGAHIHFDIVLKIIGILIICYLTRAAMILVSNFLLTNAIQSMMHDLRNALQRKIQRLPVRYFDNRAFGDVLSTVTNDVDTLSNGLQQTFTKAITGFLTFLLAFVMMFRINWKMGALALIILPLTALITKIFVGRSQKLFQLQQTNVGELNGKITELYGGFNEIILYNKQEDVKEQFKEVNERMAQSAFKAQFVSSLISPFVSLVTYLTIGAASVVGCIFVMQGSITVGSLQAFIRYIWQINEPLSQVSQLSAQVQASFAAMGRIFTLLEEEEEAQEGTASIVPEEMKGNVSFAHVQFGYGEDLLMKDVNFHVKSGQMVAIVGPTGAGKTTLMNLLLRFYDVKGGSIKIDGVDIRDMDRGKLHSLFSLVLQDTWLFHGSIYENIRYGNLNARKDEVIDAAKMANVHHFIRTLSHGYDSIINEDANNISQGEKQLLTIARAILKDPQILILDEATSSVDTRLERMLQDAMQKVMKGRTSFVIAHRLSTIKNADLILVMQDGNIIEQGTHESLLEQKGFYEQLYHSQFANGEIES
ncbi:MAG: ABC transporter ATP-binding protein [Firmicutes bacterium]|uniref:ABC transporter ATP-binding protein n=1 Tax=Candidatus Scybalomonas excrementavium TaxID=2840943 RepID=A0A9D9I079_9FIRM|nr:ABC transporter ATP-binding protein [Candidatus Scybalomonas excrementavium]